MRRFHGTVFQDCVMGARDEEHDPGGWQHLLALLGTSREVAAEKYKQLRQRLVRLFEWRGLPASEDLADETLDRVARKLAAGEEIRSEDPTRYVCGVARLVALEALRAARRARSISTDSAETWAPAEDAVDDERVRACLDECLGHLAEPARKMLLDYQVGEGRHRIEHRKSMADQLGIPLNALRIRVHRLRVDVERCVQTCIATVKEVGS